MNISYSIKILCGGCKFFQPWHYQQCYTLILEQCNQFAKRKLIKSGANLQLCTKRQYRHDPPGPGRSVLQRGPPRLQGRHGAQALLHLRQDIPPQAPHPPHGLPVHPVMQAAYTAQLVRWDWYISDILHCRCIVPVLQSNNYIEYIL